MATQPMQQSQHSFISSPNVPALHSSPIAPNDIKEEPQPEPGPRATNPATGGTTPSELPLTIPGPSPAVQEPSLHSTSTCNAHNAWVMMNQRCGI